MMIDAKYPTVSQFENGESAYECGFFTVALQTAAGKTAPTKNAEQVDELADKLYEQIDGPNTRTNTNGMSLEAWYKCLDELHIAYEKLAPEHEPIREALNAKKAVCVTIPEPSVFDLDLEDKVPYAWTPSGSHIITLVGYEPGVWYALDTANIGANGVRRWPRRYDGTKLQINLATAIVFPWLAEPPAPPAPAHETYTIQDGDTLSAIAAAHNVSVAHLLALNEPHLDDVAKQRGMPATGDGHWIFPGEVINLS